MMRRNQLFRGRPWARKLQVAAATLVTAAMSGAVGSVGCLDRPLEPVEPRRTSTIVERLTQSSVDKIDLLLSIDNSRSMADKQEILALAVPDLVKGLVNPRCIDDDGQPALAQPAGPLEDCPTEGTKREFEPVVDIHIGIVTSSLGGHGADACPGEDTNACGDMGVNYTNNDKGQLVFRMNACGGGDVGTYQEKGFLAWDPKQKLDPHGELDIEIDSNADMHALVPDLRDMVKGTGQIGCGFEAQLESWYRFLVDPEPYETISVIVAENGVPNTTPQGLDETLLAQRRDFLRPNSLLAVIVLTDENDCSIKEFGQFFFAAQLKNGNSTNFHLPRARAICSTEPNNACCKSCGQPAGKDDKGNDCPVDPTCVEGSGQVKALTETEDSFNLRCFDQKRRFGIDFLYPIDRYTQALTSPTVPSRNGTLVPNPLFTDLNPTDDISNVRDPGLVFLAGIVGVPWQDIARNKDSLKEGFKDAEELLEPTNGMSTWDIILGDPAKYVPPADPHMIEQIDPRQGTNPITGDPIAPVGSPNGTNPINGHEYTPSTARDDLQYACVFPLPTERNCNDQKLASCDCKDQGNDNPLCEEDPMKAGSRTLQTRAKAYPGVRELQVLRSLGTQGITASVCPAQLDQADSPDYGYRPAIGAIIDRLKVALGGQCLPRTLTPNEEGQVPCLILEARKVDEASVAECEKCQEPGRQPVSVSPDHRPAREAAKEDPIYETAQWNCFCEIAQVTDGEKDADGNDVDDKDNNLTACQEDTATSPLNAGGAAVDGWCYVDGTTTPTVGNPEIVEKCPETEKRIVRFVGKGSAKPGATLFITCSGE